MLSYDNAQLAMLLILRI